MFRLSRTAPIFFTGQFGSFFDRFQSHSQPIPFAIFHHRCPFQLLRPQIGRNAMLITIKEMPKFWEIKPLKEITGEEWESLCDGCGLCCLHKYIESKSGKILYTCIVCRYFDNERCRCTDYANRSRNVSNCIRLTPENVKSLDFLPATCAYRLLSAGEDLKWWHPLVSGSKDSVHEAGISIKDKAVPEQSIYWDEWEHYVMREES